MSTINSFFEKSDNLLSVTLYDCGLVKEGEHVGRVTRNTVSLENLIAEINENNTGLDPFVIQHSAILIQQQILKTLRQGKGVNILDLGIMYIGLNGTVKGSTPDASDIPDLVVRFTPSAIANQALDNLVIDKVVFADSSPHIEVITDLWTKTDNMHLTPGKICRISGNKLKIGGKDSALELFKVSEEGEEIPGTAITIDPGKICKNTKGMIEFFIPENLEASGKYKIRIKTSYITSKTFRKTPVITDSNPMAVNAGTTPEDAEKLVF